jgi:hypothetical protein
MTDPPTFIAIPDTGGAEGGFICPLWGCVVFDPDTLDAISLFL